MEGASSATKAGGQVDGGPDSESVGQETTEEVAWMVMRFDPFREADRITQELADWVRESSGTVPMDAYRRGDDVLVHFDLPGVSADSIELTVEENTLTV